jgi:hypothetical protein
MTATASSVAESKIDDAAALFIAHLVLAAFLSRIAKLRKGSFTAEGKPHLSRGKMANSAQD